MCWESNKELKNLVESSPRNRVALNGVFIF